MDFWTLPSGRGPGGGRSGAARANHADRHIQPHGRDADGPRHHPGSDARGDGHRDSACAERELSGTLHSANDAGVA